MGKRLKGLFKVALSLGLLVVVFRKIDARTAWQLVQDAHPLWLLVALVLFNGSKLVAAFRLRRLFAAVGLPLSAGYNLRLYYVGLFYNLLLPGGIGGDGYKIFVLRRKFQFRTKPLVAASFVDRLSGLVALVVLALLFLTLLHDHAALAAWRWLFVAGLVLAYPAYYLGLRWLFPATLPAFHRTNLDSLGVQGLQVLCALALLMALHVPHQFLEYTVLFLLSSVVAVLPFTIGGVGARELVFIAGNHYLGIEQDRAVVFSLLFFLITALSSLVGIFVALPDAPTLQEAEAAPDEEEPTEVDANFQSNL
ncbi:hypothetical protein SAMN05421823_10336 [Catalinimonas alkaloidigena]|uniref:Lysylphosphatidylglycerol synthase TM region n=1 Tax=Catalinimonas alkaloidigena TaxID=1075417 RepID=A0A1G9D8C5_9BACT|nr:lysylphosphatidylglycerol synthase transmembrane domain-containing protein [Catalinimonas alkaloidigena]SDK60166.1 hypothetical protein SAMN05421823_10336 [Catalinimonas alkaloidigena]